jgi:hypothetical protein
MKSTEEWKSLPGYSRYFVSKDGRVKRVRKIVSKQGEIIKELILNPRNINGYMAYTLVRDDKAKKTVYIHQAIAECFIEKPKSKDKLIVVHIDGNKGNNVVSNLEWRTFSNFMKEQFTTGRRSNKDLWNKRIKKYGPMGGLKPPGRKVDISFGQMKRIYHLYHTKGYTLKRLAEKYNCSASHIYNLLHRYELNASKEEKDTD